MLFSVSEGENPSKTSKFFIYPSLRLGDIPELSHSRIFQVKQGKQSEPAPDMSFMINQVAMKLDPLWSSLSIVIAEIEKQIQDSAETQTDANATAKILPPVAAYILPLVESFFILCSAQVFPPPVKYIPIFEIEMVCNVEILSLGSASIACVNLSIEELYWCRNASLQAPVTLQESLQQTRRIILIWKPGQVLCLRTHKLLTIRSP